MENWRVIPISAFNYVIVEVVAEIGNNAAVKESKEVTLERKISKLEELLKALAEKVHRLEDETSWG